MQPSLRPLRLMSACALAALLLAGCSKPPPNGPVTAQPPQAAGIGEHVTDAEVSNHVMTALSTEPSLHGLAITVLTTNGDIRLTGVVHTQAQVDTALRIARAAEGGHTLHDELSIKP